MGCNQHEWKIKKCQMHSCCLYVVFLLWKVFKTYIYTQHNILFHNLKTFYLSFSCPKSISFFLSEFSKAQRHFCMCMCICMFIYICMYTYICMCMYLYLYLYLYLYIYNIYTQLSIRPLYLYLYIHVMSYVYYIIYDLDS